MPGATSRANGKKGGRPKGTKDPHTLSKEAAREALRVMVTEHMRPMTEAQIASACGIKYLVGRAKKGGKFIHLTQEMTEAILRGEVTEFEAIEVWEKIPNVQAYTDLMNRALDKPAESMVLEANVNVSIEARAQRILASRKVADGR